MKVSSSNVVIQHIKVDIKSTTHRPSLALAEQLPIEGIARLEPQKVRDTSAGDVALIQAKGHNQEDSCC
jgi:hypothetical protein